MLHSQAYHTIDVKHAHPYASYLYAMSIGERIKHARNKSGISIAELARRVGVTRSSAQQWESGASKGLKPGNLAKVAGALGVSMKWLALGQGDISQDNAEEDHHVPGNVDPGPSVRRRIPLISWTTAGEWEEAMDNFPPGQADEWVFTTADVGPGAFALRLRGDSMEPTIPDGATIIVDPDTRASHNRIVVVRQNGNEATCKRLIYDGDVAYLRPDNTRYPVLKMEDDAVICGVVVSMEMRL